MAVKRLSKVYYCTHLYQSYLPKCICHGLWYIYGTIFRCWVGVCIGMLCGREHVDNKTDSRTILFWCGGKFYFKFGMTCKNICKRKRIQRNNKSLILACNLILLGHEHGANTYTPVFFRVSLIYCSIYRLRKKKMAEK